MTARFDRSLWFRLLTFLLALILLIMVPVRVYATGLEPIAIGTVAVEAAKVCLPLIAALGVMAGIDTGFFESVVDGCVIAMEKLGYVVDGCIDVVVADGKSYVGQDIIEAVRDWLFDEGVVNEVTGFALEHTVTVDNKTYVFSGYSDSYILPVAFSFSDSSGYIFYQACVLTSSRFIVKDGSNLNCDSSAGMYRYLLKSSSNPFSFDGFLDLGLLDAFPSSWASVLAGYDLGGITTTHDLTLGRVATKDATETEIETIVYVNPKILEVTNPNLPSPDDPEHKKIRLYPCKVTTTINRNITQDEAQTGDTDLEPETETDPDGDSGDSDPGTDTDPTTAPNPGGGTSPDPDLDPDNGEISDYVVELNDIFPFCIPFDIIEFFTLLCGPPEAPVFHWEIHDLAGNVYPIDVDLSDWDSFAALFRDMELLLFCFGLMWLTSKVIKW